MNNSVISLTIYTVVEANSTAEFNSTLDIAILRSSIEPTDVE